MWTAAALAIWSLALCAAPHRCQDILFPEGDDTDLYVSGNQPVLERKPVKIPNRCPENMLLYPGDGSRSVWVCDCEPYHVYFPRSDSCSKVFSRGPCPEGHFVYLAPRESVPACVANPCPERDYLPFMGACHKLRQYGPPCPETQQLGINGTTYQLDCIGQRSPNPIRRRDPASLSD